MTHDRKTPLKDAVDLFLLDGEARRLTPKTLTYYRDQLRYFLTYLKDQAIDNLQDLTAGHVRSYLVSLQARGLKDNSQHAAARAIRAWLNFLVFEGLLEKSPMQTVRMPRLDKRILPAFSEADLARLLTACADLEQPERGKAIVLCLLDSGCRVSEFSKLNIEDVDLKKGTVAVKLGKGGKDRQVYLGARARKTLVKYLMTRGTTQSTDPLWTNETGTRLTKDGIQTFLKRLGASADVKGCSPHAFRRTCSLMLHRSGARLTEIAAILGHSDLTALGRYLDLNSEDAADAHREHGPVDHLDTKKGKVKL